MPIPNEIKAIERPKCTEIRLIGNHYYVYKYTCVYDKIKKKTGKRLLAVLARLPLRMALSPIKPTNLL